MTDLLYDRPKATVTDLLSWCQGQIGVTEYPPGSNINPYADIAHLTNGLAWCHTFLVAGASELGLSLPYGTWVAGTIYAYEHWQYADMAGQEPRVGAWGYIHFPESIAGINHVEILVAPIEPGNPRSAWRTIGGNTNIEGVPGNRANGGAVAAHIRPRSYFVGFGYPAYAPQPVTPPVTIDDEDGENEMSSRPEVANCPWMPPNANGTEPYFVLAPGDTNTEVHIASINSAPFNPPFRDGFDGSWYKDFTFLGLSWRKIKSTTGPLQGALVYRDHVSVACGGGGVYEIARQQ